MYPRIEWLLLTLIVILVVLLAATSTADSIRAALGEVHVKHIKNGGNSTATLDELVNILTTRSSGETKTTYIREFRHNYERTQPLDPWITLDDIPAEIPYQPGLTFYKTSVHIGQRKLFMNEVQFCTRVTRDIIPAEFQNTPHKYLVVYVGSAPSNKGALLAKLFPSIKFIFVDPNTFDIYTKGLAPSIKVWSGYKKRNTADECDDIVRQISDSDFQINIINDLMTMNLARAISTHYPSNYFISDIRTNAWDDIPDAIDILWNNAQQLNWMMVINPVLSMLKFRHPFYTQSNTSFYEASQREPLRSDFEMAKANGVDFIGNYAKRTLEYFDGTEYLQPWAPISSTESRLVTDGKKFKKYGDPSGYDNRYLYYNAIGRTYVMFKNPFASKKLGFDHCSDCALECNIWMQYIKSTGGRVEAQIIHDFVSELSRYTKRTLLVNGHGSMFSRPSPSAVLAKIKNHQPYKPKKKYTYK